MGWVGVGMEKAHRHRLVAALPHHADESVYLRLAERQPHAAVRPDALGGDMPVGARGTSGSGRTKVEVVLLEPVLRNASL